MNRQNLPILVALVAIVALTSRVRADEGGARTVEQARGVLTKVVNYVPNVFMDFVDIFKADIALGKGSGVDLRLTRLLAAGQSDYTVTRYGLNGRHSAIYEEETADRGIGLLGLEFGKLTRDPYELGITVQIVSAGPQVAVNLRKAIDFIAGIAMIDLENDNVEYF